MPLDEPAIHAAIVKGLTHTPDLSSIDRVVQYTNIIDPATSEGSALLAAHANGLQPNFTTEFQAKLIASYQQPDGHWNTNAAMALLLALPKTAHAAVAPPMPELAPKGVQPWMRTAAFGTAAELKALLERGLDPNSRTEAGTSILMMAADDPAKTEVADRPRRGREGPGQIRLHRSDGRVALPGVLRVAETPARTRSGSRARQGRDV